MENKINIAEILKNCPRGMELDSPVWNNITFEEIDGDSIVIFRKSIGSKVYLSQCGKVNSIDGKCIIFPKGKTTWEGFEPHCQFKSGDVLVSETGNIVLLSHIDSENLVHYHCIIPTFGSFRIEENTSIGVGRYYECVLANEQQKQRMYDKIKSSGYKYNQNTNKLEKLIGPKFKVGDRIKCIYNKYKYDIIALTDTHYTLVEIKNKFQYTEEIIEDKNWELVPNKFDITTLKPFDRVLARCRTLEKWRIQLFEKYDKTYQHPFICIGCNKYTQCIPYKGNEHLLDTKDDCDEYYKTWE